MSEPLFLATEQPHVVLRELSTLEDDKAYFAAVDASREHLSQFGDPTAAKYKTLEAVTQARLGAGDKLRMGIWADDTFVGSINAIPRAEGVEVGYWLDRRHTGHGYATAAAVAISHCMSAQHGRVFAKVVEGNLNSERVLGRANYQKVGQEDDEIIFDFGPSQQDSLQYTSVEIIPATALETPERLRPVLLSAVVNPLTQEPVRDEIEEILASVPTSEAGMATKYTVAAREVGSQAILGMMALKQPDDVMRSFARSDNPIEITNAYARARRHGVGSKLVRHLEDKARADGHTEIVLVSGPRFRRKGWRFWTKTYGEPVGIAKRYFEDTYDGMVWRHSLVGEQ